MKAQVLRRAVLVVWAAAGLVLAGCAPQPAALPRLIVEQSVASDLQTLAQDTWGEFLAVFAARAGCFGDVRLRAAYELDDRAVYDPHTATVTVRAPATAAMLQGALVHEWAHHLEYQCPAHTELRPAFLAAQGLPTDTPWRPDEPTATTDRAWASIPAEQFAEAVIVLVLGRRQIPTRVRLKPEAVQVVADWAAGGFPLTSGPSGPSLPAAYVHPAWAAR